MQQQPKKPESYEGVLAESDYEWESEEEAHYELDYDDDELEVSKFINSSQFVQTSYAERVKKATKEELVEALNVIEFSIKSYENSTCS